MIKRIELEDLQEFIAISQKEGMAGYDPKAEFYGIFSDDNRIVAYTSILFYGSNKAKFKNHYTEINNRGKGLFKILFNFSINEVKKRGVKRVEATCTKMSINHYLNNGAKVIKEYKLYKKVEINL